MYRFSLATTYRTMSNSTQAQQSVFASAREEKKWNRVSILVNSIGCYVLTESILAVE